MAQLLHLGEHGLDFVGGRPQRAQRLGQLRDHFAPHVTAPAAEAHPDDEPQARGEEDEPGGIDHARQHALDQRRTEADQQDGAQHREPGLFVDLVFVEALFDLGRQQQEGAADQGVAIFGAEAARRRAHARFEFEPIAPGGFELRKGLAAQLGQGQGLLGDAGVMRGLGLHAGAAFVAGALEPGQFAIAAGHVIDMVRDPDAGQCETLRSTADRTKVRHMPELAPHDLLAPDDEHADSANDG